MLPKSDAGRVAKKKTTTITHQSTHRRTTTTSCRHPLPCPWLLSTMRSRAGPAGLPGPLKPTRHPWGGQSWKRERPEMTRMMKERANPVETHIDLTSWWHTHFTHKRGTTN